MKTTRAFLIPVAIALSLIYLPSFWFNVFCVIDFYTPWTVFESRMVEVYHSFLVSSLTEKPELPLPEMNADVATHDSVFKLSKGYTMPIVIRGLLGNSTAVQKWSDPEWWIENYGDDPLLCGTLSEVHGDECTVKGFFRAMRGGRPFYVSGASEIFHKHPELHEMIDNAHIREVEPPNRIATQVFMGVRNSGSDIHAAMGVNVFRQIVGRKKWWFIPPTETPYLKPSWNANGFSAHTLTKVGKDNALASPWLSKVTRYTTVLNPGDVLFNPPWYWHGIHNLDQVTNTSADLVIGSPVRYTRDVNRKAAFQTNFFYSLHSLAYVYYKYGSKVVDTNKMGNALQNGIAENRKNRNEDVSEKLKVTRETVVSAADGDEPLEDEI